MITKEEYELRLKENKWFEDIHETLDYRFPVIEYWLKNEANTLKQFISEKGVQQIHTSQIILKKPDANNNTSFTLVNIAYNFIIDKNKKNE